MACPEVKFVTKIFHPKIDSTGAICKSCMNVLGRWSPAYQTLTSILWLLKVFLTSIAFNYYNAWRSYRMLWLFAWGSWTYSERCQQILHYSKGMDIKIRDEFLRKWFNANLSKTKRILKLWFDHDDSSFDSFRRTEHFFIAYKARLSKIILTYILLDILNIFIILFNPNLSYKRRKAQIHSRLD